MKNETRTPGAPRGRETPTPTQTAILECIQRHVRERRFAPTPAELSREFAVHRNTMVAHLERLVRKGWLGTLDLASRRVRLLHTGTPVLETGTDADTDDAGVDRPRTDGIASLLGTAPALYVLLARARRGAAALGAGDIVAIAPGGNPRPGALVAVEAAGTVRLRRARAGGPAEHLLGTAIGAIAKLGETPRGECRDRARNGVPAPVEPTKAQAIILEEIRDYWRRHQHPPTRADIAKRLNVSRRLISTHVDHLRKRGWLRLEAHRERALTLRRPGEPIYVEGAPGQLDAVDPPRIATVEALLGADPDLFVRAGADTPGDTGLSTGDIAAIATKREPAASDTVAVRIDGVVRLRRWYPDRPYTNCPEPWGSRGSPADIIGVAFAAVVSIAPSAGRQRGRRDEPGATADRAEGAKGGDAKRAGHGTIAAVV